MNTSLRIAAVCAAVLAVGYCSQAQAQTANEKDAGALASMYVPPPLRLLGQPAPQFTLDRLNGAKFDLASHLGKNIVVLDFWASWCPPCRVGLPILTEVAAQYKKDPAKKKADGKPGVVFYGVNLAEPTKTIQAFLEQSKLKFDIALDKTYKAARLYKVEGIPQTVIIGLDGTVQAVHIGVAPDLREKLKKELDTLVAGDLLVAKKTP
ncbi:MAG: redoxin domain-containing protein [Nitrospiraceae bacterium]|nr:redoxin domain-containing protein [Nitrospiraceae bacterium]